MLTMRCYNWWAIFWKSEFTSKQLQSFFVNISNRENFTPLYNALSNFKKTFLILPQVTKRGKNATNDYDFSISRAQEKNLFKNEI